MTSPEPRRLGIQVTKYRFSFHSAYPLVTANLNGCYSILFTPCFFPPIRTDHQFSSATFFLFFMPHFKHQPKNQSSSRASILYPIIWLICKTIVFLGQTEARSNIILSLRWRVWPLLLRRNIFPGENFGVGTPNLPSKGIARIVL